MTRVLPAYTVCQTSSTDRSVRLTEPTTISLHTAYGRIFALKLGFLDDLAIFITCGSVTIGQHADVLELFRILTIEIFAFNMLLRLQRAASFASRARGPVSARHGGCTAVEESWDGWSK